MSVVLVCLEPLHSVGNMIAFAPSYECVSKHETCIVDFKGPQLQM